MCPRHHHGDLQEVAGSMPWHASTFPLILLPLLVQSSFWCPCPCSGKHAVCVVLLIAHSAHENICFHFLHIILLSAAAEPLHATLGKLRGRARAGCGQGQGRGRARAGAGAGRGQGRAGPGPGPGQGQGQDRGRDRAGPGHDQDRRT